MNAQEHLFPVTMGQLLERRNVEIPLLQFSANYREAMGDKATADRCRQHLAMLALPLETLTDDQLHDAFSLTGLQYIVRAA